VCLRIDYGSKKGSFLYSKRGHFYAYKVMFYRSKMGQKWVKNEVLCTPKNRVSRGGKMGSKRGQKGVFLGV